MEGIFILNSDGNFVHLNEKALAFIGKKHERLIGKPFISIAPKRTGRNFMLYAGICLMGKALCIQLQILK
ncbi:MAG: PAS domain-containing protein [Candidatus Thermoplasmatota archaeon]|nr:PAS domain-containing protein [Candidatus Thermoplasmatota archaeon]